MRELIAALIITLAIATLLPVQQIYANHQGAGSKQMTKIELFIPQPTIELGKEVTFIATLREDNGRTLEDETLIFTVDGTDVGTSKTDRNGNTEFIYKPSSAGELKVKVVFKETKEHVASMSSIQTFTIKPPQQQLAPVASNTASNITNNSTTNPLFYVAGALVVVSVVGFAVIKSRKKAK